MFVYPINALAANSYVYPYIRVLHFFVSFGLSFILVIASVFMVSYTKTIKKKNNENKIINKNYIRLSNIMYWFLFICALLFMMCCLDFGVFRLINEFIVIIPFVVSLLISIIAYLKERTTLAFAVLAILNFLCSASLMF
jgi:hypothetical protein